MKGLSPAWTKGQARGSKSGGGGDDEIYWLHKGGHSTGQTNGHSEVNVNDLMKCGR